MLLLMNGSGSFYDMVQMRWLRRARSRKQNFSPSFRLFKIAGIYVIVAVLLGFLPNIGLSLANSDE